MSMRTDEIRLPPTEWTAYRGVLSRRVMAFLVDYLFVAVLWIPASIVLAFVGVLTLGLAFVLYPALFAIVAMLYFGLTVGGRAQASPGMRMMGLRIARTDGRPMDFLTAIVHLVIFWLANALLTPFIVLIGLFTERGRLLHDFLIGTVTIRSDSY